MLVLDVSGMTSDASAKAIQEAITARDRDAVVVVMRIAGRVSVDSTLRADDLVAVVTGAGYPAMIAFVG